MIPLTRLDGTTFYLNPSLMLTLEETPDTVLHMTTGTSIIVLESAEDVIALILRFQRRVTGADALSPESEGSPWT